MEHKAVDILIIGSGASGAAVAWRLSDAGFKVICLEQGDWLKPEDYLARLRGLGVPRRHELNFEPNVRRAAGETIRSTTPRRRSRR